jgi:hypothetical protein
MTSTIYWHSTDRGYLQALVLTWTSHECRSQFPTVCRCRSRASYRGGGLPSSKLYNVAAGVCLQVDDNPAVVLEVAIAKWLRSCVALYLSPGQVDTHRPHLPAGFAAGIGMTSPLSGLPASCCGAIWTFSRPGHTFSTLTSELLPHRKLSSLPTGTSMRTTCRVNLLTIAYPNGIDILSVVDISSPHPRHARFITASAIDRHKKE